MMTDTILNAATVEYAMDLADGSCQCGRCGVAIEEGEGVTPLRALHVNEAYGQQAKYFALGHRLGVWCRACSRRWRPQRT